MSDNFDITSFLMMLSTVISCLIAIVATIIDPTTSKIIATTIAIWLTYAVFGPIIHDL